MTLMHSPAPPQVALQVVYCVNAWDGRHFALTGKLPLGVRYVSKLSQILVMAQEPFEDAMAAGIVSESGTLIGNVAKRAQFLRNRARGLARDLGLPDDPPIDRPTPDPRSGPRWTAIEPRSDRFGRLGSAWGGLA